MFLLPILAIVLLFSLSIFVHELGHFLAARALGMAADVFSIGMGPALWKRRFGATVWKIGAIPFGGYVALPQMDPNSFLEGQETGDRGQGAGDRGQGAGDNRGQGSGVEGAESRPLNPEPRILPRVAPWKKIIVSVSGAAGNVVFAFLLATVVWIAGKPSSLQERSAVIGFVEADSAAAAAGLAPGDEILALNGRPVASWLELAEGVALAPADAVTLRVRAPAGSGRDVALELEASEVGLRMLPGLDGLAPCHVAALMPGSGAEAAGLRPGDQILRYDGRQIYSRAHLSQLVEAAGARPAEIVVLRGGQEVAAAVESTFDEDSGRRLIGIEFNTLSDLDYATRTHPTPWAQVKSHAGSIFRFLGALTTPATSGAAAGAVGGPVLILIMLWLMVKSSFVLAIWFTGLLNVNLAILNLLPVPILDGGHVVMNLYEWIVRRPPPPRVVNALANVFAVLFIALFLLLIYRDSVRHLLPPLRHWFGG
ncbi:MAG: site-2 protease family protein [Kiritimatiellae bacterium]|nr:site-2 protease family protein [Kiritimatiellia bacterium]